jgi:hypothetical protein
MGSSHALAPEISAGQPLLLPPSYFLLFSLPAARNADVPVGNTGASYFILSMISDILASPEGKTLEFKRDLSTPTPILKTLVAFANSAGRIRFTVMLPEILPLTREQSRATLPTRAQSGLESGLESLASRILAVLGNTGAFFLPPSYLIL